MKIFYSALWGRIGYHISSNQYETTIFGPKIMKIGVFLAEIPPFHYMARIGHWWGSMTPAGTGSACEGLRFCKGLTYDPANESLWIEDNDQAIDRDLKPISRGATPNTVERQAELLGYCPYLGITQKWWLYDLKLILHHFVTCTLQTKLSIISKPKTFIKGFLEVAQIIISNLNLFIICPPPLPPQK